MMKFILVALVAVLLSPLSFSHDERTRDAERNLDAVLSLPLRDQVDQRICLASLQQRAGQDESAYNTLRPLVPVLKEISSPENTVEALRRVVTGTEFNKIAEIRNEIGVNNEIRSLDYWYTPKGELRILAVISSLEGSLSGIVLNENLKIIDRIHRQADLLDIEVSPNKTGNKVLILNRNREIIVWTERREHTVAERVNPWTLLRGDELDVLWSPDGTQALVNTLFLVTWPKTGGVKSSRITDAEHILDLPYETMANMDIDDLPNHNPPYVEVEEGLVFYTIDPESSGLYFLRWGETKPYPIPLKEDGQKLYLGLSPAEGKLEYTITPLDSYRRLFLSGPVIGNFVLTLVDDAGGEYYDVKAVGKKFRVPSLNPKLKAAEKVSPPSGFKTLFTKEISEGRFFVQTLKPTTKGGRTRWRVFDASLQEVVTIKQALKVPITKPWKELDIKSVHNYPGFLLKNTWIEWDLKGNVKANNLALRPQGADERQIAKEPFQVSPDLTFVLGNRNFTSLIDDSEKRENFFLPVFISPDGSFFIAAGRDDDGPTLQKFIRKTGN